MADRVTEALSLLDSHPCSEARHLHRVALDALLAERDAARQALREICDLPPLVGNEDAQKIAARALVAVPDTEKGSNE